MIVKNRITQNYPIIYLDKSQFSDDGCKVYFERRKLKFKR